MFWSDKYLWLLIKSFSVTLTKDNMNKHWKHKQQALRVKQMLLTMPKFIIIWVDIRVYPVKKLWKESYLWALNILNPCQYWQLGLFD